MLNRTSAIVRSTFLTLTRHAIPKRPSLALSLHQRVPSNRIDARLEAPTCRDDRGFVQFASIERTQTRNKS